MHKIIVDAAGSTVIADLSGFWTVGEVDLYAREVAPIIRRLAAAGPYQMLIDASACAIQSQEVVLAFKRHVAAVPQAHSLAFVTASAMVGMQVQRIMNGPRMRIFSTRDEAFAWLPEASVALRQA